MSDLDSYLTRCYALLFGGKEPQAGDDEELCACASLIRHEEQETR